LLVSYPSTLYLTLVTTGLNENGEFSIEYQYVDRDPNTVIESLSDEQRLEIVKT